MPVWLIAYILLALAATVALARRNFGVDGGRRLLPAFLLWLTSIAIAGLVLWTLIACTYLHRQRLSFIPLCLFGSAIWAAVIVGAYVPGYAAILAALLRLRAGVLTAKNWVLLAAALALPAGLALFLGYAWPDNSGDVDLKGGLAPAIMAWASMFGALLSTRRLMPASAQEVPARAA